MTRVLLVGLMATGKSSVAQAISASTGWPAYENDELLQHSTGRTAAQLLADGGTGHLRAAESAVLAQTLALPEPMVAGVAAGVVLDPGDRERLRTGGHVVWLRAAPETLVRRLPTASHRPFLDEDPLVTLRAMAAEREPLFAEVAHQVLDVDDQSPARSAELVVAAVRG